MLIFSNVLSIPGTLVITCFRTEVFFWKAHRALMGEVDPIACELKMCLCLTAVEHYMPKWMIPSNFAPGEAFFVKNWNLDAQFLLAVTLHCAIVHTLHASCGQLDFSEGENWICWGGTVGFHWDCHRICGQRQIRKSVFPSLPPVHRRTGSYLLCWVSAQCLAQSKKHYVFICFFCLTIW